MVTSAAPEMSCGDSRGDEDGNLIMNVRRQKITKIEIFGFCL